MSPTSGAAVSYLISVGNEGSDETSDNLDGHRQVESANRTHNECDGEKARLTMTMSRKMRLKILGRGRPVARASSRRRRGVVMVQSMYLEGDRERRNVRSSLRRRWKVARDRIDCASYHVTHRAYQTLLVGWRTPALSHFLPR